MAENELPAKPIEASEADAYEQHRPVVEGTSSRDSRRDPEEPDVPPQEIPQNIPSDVDPADAYEQTRIVDYDEDDYR
jgi:hypothetical protein